VPREEAGKRLDDRNFATTAPLPAGDLRRARVEAKERRAQIDREDQDASGFEKGALVHSSIILLSAATVRWREAP
jgi:hypothetical protein